MIVISKAYRPVFYILLQKANWYYMLILSFLSMLSRMPICPPQQENYYIRVKKILSFH